MKNNPRRAAAGQRCGLLGLILPLCLLLASDGAQAAPRKAQTFHNPILTAAADPYITYTHGKYYLLYTDVSHTHTITVRSSASLATLGAAPAVPIYDAGGFFESPELFEFGKRWYIYYTRFPNTVNVLESDTDNPQGKYHFKAALTTNTYDADLLKMPSGALYLLSSEYNSIRIQPLSNPYTVSGPQTAIAVKTQPWETGAIEAPNAFWHNKQLFILYSAGNYNKDNYAAGALRFNGGDPASPGAWTKLPGPLLTENPAGGIWDAGVPSAFSVPDGQAWFTYSDYNAPDGADPHRSILVQPMRFDAQGNPVLGPALPLTQTLQAP
jgi:GH43 family beta-xylosidase